MTAAEGQNREKPHKKMSPVCKQAELPSLRRSEPQRLCRVPTPALHVTLKEACRQLPSTSAQGSLSPWNSKKGMAAALQPGIVGTGVLQNSEDKTTLVWTERKKKVKSTNDQGCSVGTTATGMPDSPPHAQLRATALLWGQTSPQGQTLTAQQLTGHSLFECPGTVPCLGTLAKLSW